MARQTNPIKAKPIHLHHLRLIAIIRILQKTPSIQKSRTNPKNDRPKITTNNHISNPAIIKIFPLILEPLLRNHR